jgi:hypothetical protein
MTVAEILTAMNTFMENTGLMPFVFAAIIATVAIKIWRRLANA